MKPKPGSETKAKSAPSQPKIVQKALLRTAFLLFAMAGVFIGVRYVMAIRDNQIDSLGPADTKGMLTAIHYLPDGGSQVVAFKQDGNMIPSADYAQGKNDQDAVWTPDGTRVFFSSDRQMGGLHLFRWNPDANKVEQLSSDSGNHSNPFFGGEGADDRPIIVSRGLILEFDPEKKSSTQLLPFRPKEIVVQGADSDIGGQFDMLYKQLGNSFSTARWMHNKTYIAAVMNRDEGQILILQNMDPQTEAEAAPEAIIAGAHIDIDVDQSGNRLVYTVRDVLVTPVDKDIDEVVKSGGKVEAPKRPFVNALGVIDLKAKQRGFIAKSVDGKVSYGQPAISPDGSSVMYTQGKTEGDSYRPSELMIAPVGENGAAQGASLVKGEVYEPAWRWDSEQFAFVMREGDNRSIFVVSKGTATPQRFTSSGEFGHPRFSPMNK